jgi:hypothetical protein
VRVAIWWEAVFVMETHDGIEAGTSRLSLEQNKYYNSPHFYQKDI